MPRRLAGPIQKVPRKRRRENARIYNRAFPLYGSEITMRVALYLRVSTSSQTVENQERELTAVTAARGWLIVETHGRHCAGHGG